jgi:hypothetical protein
MQSQNSAHLPPTARRFAHLRAFGLHMLLLVLLCGVAAAVQPVAAQGESELSIELVGSIDISGSVRTVHVVGNYAYVGSEQGLQIVDISDSANLALIGNYDMQGGIYNTHVADGYAYVVGRDAGTIWILDVRDPANPTLMPITTARFPYGIMIR